MRWGLGPVFLYECLANSRRWLTYALRSVGVAILLASMATIAMSRTATAIDPTNPWRAYAALGQSYFYAIIGVELTVVLLAAPAATAGAICVDRARGTLTHILATDLSDPEIVLGKLAARLLPILGMVACTWPVLAICSLLGGIDPTALSLAFAIILAVALLGCTMAMALSVWARKPHEVIVATYTVFILGPLFWPIWSGFSLSGKIGPPPRWTLLANPFYVAFAPYFAPGKLGFWDYLAFFGVALGASAVLTALAVWKTRPVSCRGTVEKSKTPRIGMMGRITRWLPGPSLDRNPVLWREWHRSRPSRWLMILFVIGGGATGIACVGGAISIWANGLDHFNRAPGAWTVVGVYGWLLQLVFGFLMLSAVAPMSMSEERQRGSLDLLATTTLSTPTIVVGKWLGALRLVLLLAIGSGLIGFALATAHKTPPAAPTSPGLSAYDTVELSTSERLFGAALMVATVLIHGMLLSTIGLALAVWIKRQSRAIAISVGLAVTLYVGWPIFVGVSLMGPGVEGMMGLSPVVASMTLMANLSRRGPGLRDILGWTSFWDIESLLLSLGLLWLTVRTFDGCFGRIPERPRRISVLSDIVLLLAALIGAGSLFGSIDIWVHGWSSTHQRWDSGIVACAILIAVGLLLLSVKAPLSISPRGTPRALALQPSAAIPDRRLFAGRWWDSFRLVLLLAIGPALIGLALVTVHRPLRVVEKVTTLVDGSRQRIWTDDSGITYVMTIGASGRNAVRQATDAEIAAGPFEPRPSRASLLSTAFLAVLTVLAHGAWVVSLGLALGIGLRRREPARSPRALASSSS